MADVTVNSILDTLNGSFKDYGEPKIHQIATRLPRYEVMGRLMRKEKRLWGGPHGIQEQVMTDHSGAAHETGLHGVYDYATQDVMAEMSVPWRHLHTYYAYERREFLMNKNPKRIYNLVKMREAQGLISLAELMEKRFWGSPTSDSAHPLRVYGVFYWLVYNATVGITGGNHSGYSSGRGGINSNTYTRWKNGAGQYTKVSKGDAIASMRNLADDCYFESPVDIADFRKGRGDNWRWYCGRPTMRGFENVGESQNENLGKDIASMDGVITFRRNPIIRVPRLDSMASAPIVGLNWDWIKLCFLKGDYLHRHEARSLDAQPNTIVVDLDLTWQLAFFDLRSQIMLAKSDPLTDLAAEA